jgi:uncharacterized protein (TIGR00725 family)
MSNPHISHEHHAHTHSVAKITDIKFCVSGAAETGHCGIDAYEKAKELGRQIVCQGGTLLTGATTGFPIWAAIGAKEANGFSIGISPARTEEEHVHVYRLPLDHMDMVVYTGLGYSGRDIVLTNSGDAVFFGCGRIGTIHEFTVAFEDEKPIGILEGDWATDEVLKLIIEKGNRPNSKIVFDSDPKALVEKVMALVLKEKKRLFKTYENVKEAPATFHL